MAQFITCGWAAACYFKNSPAAACGRTQSLERCTVCCQGFMGGGHHQHHALRPRIAHHRAFEPGVLGQDQALNPEATSRVRAWLERAKSGHGPAQMAASLSAPSFAGSSLRDIAVGCGVPCQAHATVNQSRPALTRSRRSAASRSEPRTVTRPHLVRWILTPMPDALRPGVHHGPRMRASF